MATAFVLSAYGLDGKPIEVGKNRFTALPIRIGRNGLNDFTIGHGFVSSFHARIEEVEGKICVRDLSSRNGIHVQPGPNLAPLRVAPQTPIDLSQHAFQFFLGPYLRVAIEFVPILSEIEQRSSAAVGSVLGNPAMLLQAGPSAPPHPNPQPMPGWPAAAPTPAPHPPNAAVPPPFGAPGPTGPPPAHLPPLAGFGSPSGYPGQPPMGSPGLAGPAGIPGFPGAPPGSGQPAQPWQPVDAPQRAAGRNSKSTEFFGNMGIETLALQGLRELAGSLVPAMQLETTGDVARFITKLHDAMEVFCRCFIPLREGHAQFVSSLDLQRSALQRSQYRSRAYQAVEMARSSEAVLAALLDWRDRSLDASEAIEGIFADLMLHQVALLEGVMRGVRALLEQLSPEGFESQHATGPLGLPVGRHKALWRAYRERYDELSGEEQAFAHIFGPEFVVAYRQYQKRRADGDENS